MESKILVNLEDRRGEIITNDYYIKIYEDGKLVDTKRYEDFPENNKIENVEKELNIKEGHNYKLELAVKIRLRDYVISTFEFNTKNGEILGISNREEYLEIQPEGNYIILNNLDFRDLTHWTSSRKSFQGSINFNGKTLYKQYNAGNNSPCFESIGENGRIENLVLKVYITNEMACTGNNLFELNYGTISNIFISLEESIEKNNGYIRMLGAHNYGIIENFVINYKDTLYGQNVWCIEQNHAFFQTDKYIGNCSII